MLLAEKTIDDGPLLVDDTRFINGSVLNDTIVHKNCSLHIRGNLKGNLTIEQGASVVIEGAVDGKVVNNGGRLVVHHKGIVGFLRVDGPPEAEAGGILKVDLTAIVFNWEMLAKRVACECAAVVKADAYGCGIEPVVTALTEIGCKTFFVSNLAEARRVRAAAPQSIVYVLNGLFAGNGATFAEINVRPVINSLVEMAEWDAFVASSQWTGGFALNFDIGQSRHGLPLPEASALAARTQSPGHGIALLVSQLDQPGPPDNPLHDRQFEVLQDLRRLYGGVPVSVAGSSGIFAAPKLHFDLVRPGAALFGLNPTPGATNPMVPVVELKARIVQVHNLSPGETTAHQHGWTAKRPTRVAMVAVGYADGYPRSVSTVAAPQAIVGNQLCPIIGRSMDQLAIDVTDLAAPSAARRDGMVTLIGGEISVDGLAAATASSGREILSILGHRFHRVCYAT